MHYIDQFMDRNSLRGQVITKRAINVEPCLYWAKLSEMLTACIIL